MAVFQCVLNFVILHILWDFFKESIGFIKLPKRSVVPKKKKKGLRTLINALIVVILSTHLRSFSEVTSKGRAELWGNTARGLFSCCGAVMGAGVRAQSLPPPTPLPPCDCPALITHERKWTHLQVSLGLSVCDLASVTENGV